MADNFSGQLSGTNDPAPARAKDRAGVKTQIVAVDLNPAGAETLMAGGMPVSSVVTGTGVTNLGKAAGDAQGSVDVGPAILVVRRDAASPGSGVVDGDYGFPSMDANGAIRVTGSSGATEYTEDAAAVANPVGSILNLRRRDTLTAAEVTTDGDIITANATSKGQLHTFTEVGSMPGAEATTDDVASVPVTGGIATLGSPNTMLTPKFIKIAASSNGVNIVVAAVTSKKIRVLSWSIFAAAAVNAKWQSHTTPTDLTGLHYMAANGGISVAFSPTGHFESLSGESLDLNLSGAQAVGGSLVYVEV